MTLHGTVKNGQIMFDPPKQLPEGTRVEVVVIEDPTEKPSQQEPALADRLLKYAGAVPGLPRDLAEQHDHYIHGTPKR